MHAPARAPDATQHGQGRGRDLDQIGTTTDRDLAAIGKPRGARRRGGDGGDGGGQRQADRVLICTER